MRSDGNTTTARATFSYGLFRCPKCGHEWPDKLPQLWMKPPRCPECGKHKASLVTPLAPFDDRDGEHLRSYLVRTEDEDDED